jgi:hypothetical protein
MHVESDKAHGGFGDSITAEPATTASSEHNARPISHCAGAEFGTISEVEQIGTLEALSRLNLARQKLNETKALGGGILRWLVPLRPLVACALLSGRWSRGVRAPRARRERRRTRSAGRSQVGLFRPG